MSCNFCSREPAEGTLSGSNLCLVPATLDVHEIVADVLAEHNVLFERRGPLLALLDYGEPSRVVELLRHILTDTEKRDLMVASIGASGFPERHSLDDWWGMREASWFDHALSRSLFSTWFQPVVDTACDGIVGYECLTRLRTGSGGSTRNYSGAEIFDAAQLRRQERILDSQLRRLAIERAAEREGTGAIFVNFLPQAIYDPEICLADAMAAIDECGMEPNRVVFEAVQALDFEPAHLGRIGDWARQEGCRFSIDDVGAGRDAAALVGDLRPDFIKLAASLTYNVETPAGATAVRRLVEVADRVGTAVIAKHVENSRTMENLWLLSVRFMQGYLFGRPAPEPVAPKQGLLNLIAAMDPECTAEYSN